MLMIGKNSKKKKKHSAFSLIEILVSLAIFSVIISTVLVITVSMISAQKKIQAKLFLTQTAQSTIESMSRQIRYGYTYSGASLGDYDPNAIDPAILLRTNITSAGASATSSVDLRSLKASNLIIFESQNGNPNSFADQNAFCVAGERLYKVAGFQVQTDGLTYEAKCKEGSPMLPDNVLLEMMSFDIFTSDPINPINPMVRIKLRLKHEDTGSMDIQTTITQRVVSYF